MPRHDLNPVLSLLTLGSRLAVWPLTWWEMYWAAVETVGYRTSLIAASGFTPDARQQRENLRMVNEKTQASLESWRALTRAGAPSGDLWAWPLLWFSGLAETADAMTRPWHRRVTANARRLRRRQ